jgi:hypothetical protein
VFPQGVASEKKKSQMMIVRRRDDPGAGTNEKKPSHGNARTEIKRD